MAFGRIRIFFLRQAEVPRSVALAESNICARLVEFVALLNRIYQGHWVPSVVRYMIVVGA